MAEQIPDRPAKQLLERGIPTGPVELKLHTGTPIQLGAQGGCTYVH